MIINLNNAIIEKVQTMADRSIQIRIGMPELPPHEMANIFTALNSKTVTVNANISESEGKTPSQRLRSVLYIYWSQFLQHEFTDFDSFYRHEIESLINQYKSKLM